MKNIIIIEGKESYQYDSIEDVVKQYIDKDYYNLTDDEKHMQLEKKAYMNTLMYKIPVIDIKKGDSFSDDYIEQDIFIIYDEITHILSLMKIGKIVVLENINSNCFNQYINMESINPENNYVNINKFVDVILLEYLNK